jgi:hypothetical protein
MKEKRTAISVACQAMIANDNQMYKEERSTIKGEAGGKDTYHCAFTVRRASRSSIAAYLGSLRTLLGRIMKISEDSWEWTADKTWSVNNNYAVYTYV